MSLPYPQYKPISSRWLSGLPDHWSLVPLKRLLDIQNGRDHKAVESDDGYPVYGSGGVFAKASAYLGEGPSVLLGRKGTIDRPLYVQGRFWTVDTMYWSRVQPGTEPRFAYYAALTIPFAFYSTDTALPSMTKGVLDAHLVPLPTPEEQHAIATFLDRETAKIDALVAEQGRLKTLLHEERLAAIFRAVTLGLRADAALLSSRIPGVDAVPAHWRVARLGRLVNQVGSGTTPPSDAAHYYEEAAVPWVNTGDLDDAQDVEPKRHVSQLALDSLSALRVYPSGSLLVAMYGATIGKLGLLGMPATVNQACCAIVGGAVTTRFLFYFLLGLRPQLISMAFGGGQPNISQETLRGFLVTCPPLQEQEQIVAYLDDVVRRTNSLVSECERSRTLLVERRAALISAAVTGQIDVRGLVAA